jgi:excisionase family DNA binding protein
VLENPISFVIDPGPLAELVRRLVVEALADLDAQRQQLPDRLAYTQAEAARLLGLHSHQLRDERRRGRISASQIVGKRIRYTREDLLKYLTQHRVEGT